MSLPNALSETDEFDLLLLEVLVERPENNYKQIAEILRVDQRTVAARIKNLTTRGVLKQTVEVDWSKLGLRADAFVGSTTVRGMGYARKLRELVETDPRVVEAYETIGSYHHFMRIIERDTYSMRDSVLRELDILASELTTTLVTKRLKRDYGSLIQYLRETRFPGSRRRGIEIT